MQYPGEGVIHRLVQPPLEHDTAPERADGDVGQTAMGAEGGGGTRNSLAAPGARVRAMSVAAIRSRGMTRSTHPVARAADGISGAVAVAGSCTTARPPARLSARMPAAPSSSRPVSTTPRA